MDPSTTAPLTCDGGEEGDDVGVWQFVHGSQDGQNRLYGFALCQYADKVDKPPKVPYTACTNADCSTHEGGWGSKVDP